MFNDVIFHYVFGSTQGAECLRHLINAVLRDSNQTAIDSLVIRNPFNYTEFLHGKQSIIDVRAKEEGGRYINVEVQINPQKNYLERVLYYWSKTYCDQLLEGDDWQNLVPTLAISFSGFPLFPHTSELHVPCEIRATHDPTQRVTDHLQFHFLDFSRLSKLSDRTILNKEIVSIMYYMVHNHEENNPLLVKIQQQYTEVLAMENRYRNAVDDEHIRLAAEIQEKARRDYAGQMNYAKEIGFNTGREEGHKVGLEEGLEEGIGKGRIEKSQSYLILLLNKKFGLTKEEEQSILNCDEEVKLDKALLEILTSETKAQVLDLL